MTCFVGVDFGSAEHEYAHAVMERTLASSGAALPPQWALQDPADSIKALQEAVPAAVRAAGIRPDAVVGSVDALYHRYQNVYGQH